MIKMLALKTGDRFFEIDFSRKCYAANRSSVTLYKICGKSGYINLGKVFEGTIMECKQFGAVKKSATKPVDSLDMEAHGL